MEEPLIPTEPEPNPLKELTDSPEFQFVSGKLDELRIHYIGKDEISFRKVDSAHQVLKFLTQ